MSLSFFLGCRIYLPGGKWDGASARKATGLSRVYIEVADGVESTLGGNT